MKYYNKMVFLQVKIKDLENILIFQNSAIKKPCKPTSISPLNSEYPLQSIDYYRLQMLCEPNCGRVKNEKANWKLTLIKFVISEVYDRSLCVAGQLSLALGSARTPKRV